MSAPAREGAKAGPTSTVAARVRTGATLAVGAAALLCLDGLFPSGWLALAVVAVLALGSAVELDRMGNLAGRGLRAGHVPAALACGVLLLASFRGFWSPRPELVLAGLYALTAAAAALGLLLRARPRAWALVVGLALWSIPPLYSVVLVDRAFGVSGLVVLVVLAKIGDNAGYFVGRAIGKRHPFPTISPGKTVAGCVASLLAGTVTGALVLPATLGAFDARGVGMGALLGAQINLAAQAGDLSESWVKRRAGVKDSGTWFGPSGGLLDVIDSLLLAAPVALLAWSSVYGVPDG